MLSSAPDIHITVIIIWDTAEILLPRHYDLIKCVVTERVSKRQAGLTRGTAVATILRSGAIPPEYNHRLQLQTRVGFG